MPQKTGIELTVIKKIRNFAVSNNKDYEISTKNCRQ